MNDNVTIRLTGVDDIDKVLKELPAQINHRVMLSANAAAAKVLVTKEKLLAPEGPTGRLIDSIGIVRSSFGRANALGEIVVGPRRAGRYKGYAAHLVEYGTVVRHNRYLANRGKMTPAPFVEPAFKQTQGAIQDSINDQIGRKLYAFMKRTIKNSGQ